MPQIDEAYSYLQENYNENEPILLSEINIPGMKPVSLRQQLKKLTEDGRLKRFDTGIYYLPKKSLFRFGSMLSPGEVIRKKYMLEDGRQCGYLSGMMLANQLGLTTQVPTTYEVYTNKATTDYRDTTVGSMRVIIRKPYVEVNDNNVKALQFLDLIKEVSDVSELKGAELTARLTAYMKASGLNFNMLQQYLPYYPDRIYRNLYEAGLLNGVAT